ncbi:hypothetical protein AB7C87_10625 [Natrarchaeobius sp. A-rgal3]|uniref:hypothetical protein n=1 Tax=Natrarchaeobius versutus TaxID=1679078 RepID=UPI00350FC68A
MIERSSVVAASRWIAVAAVLALLAVLAWFLPQPGFSGSRVALFALIAGAAILGAAGLLRRRMSLAVAGAVFLFLLGFWQAVLGVFILPVVALLLVAAVLEDERSEPRPA